MADFEFNVAKGKTIYYGGLPAANDALVMVLLQSSSIEADSTLKDHDTLASILAGTSSEATFTNYARQTLASVAATVNDTNDWTDLDAADVTISSAGGATNNTLAKAVVCYDPDTTAGTDADLIPLTAHDVTVTTDGSDLNLAIPTGGFFRAT